MSLSDLYVHDRVAKRRQRIRGRIERKQRMIRKLRGEIEQLEKLLDDTLGVPRVFVWRGRKRATSATKIA